MENNKTKSWPFIVSGCLLIIQAMISFVSDILAWIRANTYSNLEVPFFTYFQFIQISVFLALGIMFFFKKKNWITVALLSVLYLKQFSGFIKMFSYLFHWPVLYSITRFFSVALPLTATFILLAIVILSLIWPRNFISKILWILPPIVHFMSTIISVVYSIIEGRFYATQISMVLGSLFYCIVLTFLGFALQSPVAKPSKIVAEEQPEVVSVPVVEEVPVVAESPVVEEVPVVAESPVVEAILHNDTLVQDATNEIRNYKKLLDDGIITEEEFQAKKKQLMGI